MPIIWDDQQAGGTATLAPPATKGRIVWDDEPLSTGAPSPAEPGIPAGPVPPAESSVDDWYKEYYNREMALQQEKGPDFRYQESLEQAAEPYGGVRATLSAPFRAGHTAALQLAGGIQNIGLTAAAEGVQALGDLTGVEGIKEDAEAIRQQRDSFRGLVRRFSDEQAAIDAKGAPGTSSVRQGLAALGEAATAAYTGGLPTLAGYYAANSGSESLALADDEKRSGAGKYIPAAAHAIIEGVATLLGGKLGSGTAALAGRTGERYGSTIVGKAVGKVAEKYSISKPIAEFFGAAGAEATEEMATEVAHYLTDKAQPGDYQGASLKDRLVATFGPAFVAGGAGRALDSIASQIEKREQALPAAAELARKVEANEPISRGDLEKAGVPSYGTNAKTRKEIARKEIESVQLPEAPNEQQPIAPPVPTPTAQADQAADPDVPAEQPVPEAPQPIDPGAGLPVAPPPPQGPVEEGVVAPPSTPVPPAQQGSTEPVGGDFELSREGSADRSPVVEPYQVPAAERLPPAAPRERQPNMPGMPTDMEPGTLPGQQGLFDQPQTAVAEAPPEPTISKRQLTNLSNRVDKLREKLDQDTLDDVDLLLSQNPSYLNDVFTEAQALADTHNTEMRNARSEWSTVFGNEAAKLGAKARRKGAKGGDAAGTFRAFDQTVQFLRDNPEAAPAITAAAERAGDGDLEAGLFQVLQGGKQQFTNKTAEDFLPDVVRQAADDLTSFGPEMGENFFVAKERAGETGKQLISAANIKRTFPGAKVSQRSDNRWRVKLPNGVAIQVASVPNLQINPEYAAQIRQRYPGVTDAQWEKIEAAGLYHVSTRDGNRIPVRSLIALSQSMEADQSTLNHEALHAARSMGLFTDAEWSKLKGKYAKNLTDEGAIEEAIASGMEGRGGKKFRDRIREFFDKLLKSLGFKGLSPNVQAIMADEAFWSRTPQSGVQSSGTQFQMEVDEESAPGVTLYHNPSREQLKSLRKNSKYGELRGIENPYTSDISVWDAARSGHQWIAERLGLEWNKDVTDNNARLYVKNDGQIDIMMDRKAKTGSVISGAKDTQFQLRSKDPEVQRKLANIGLTQDVREHLAELDRLATEAGEPGTRPDAAVEAEADSRLAADRDAEVKAIIRAGQQGGQLNDVQTVIAKRVFQEQAFDALKSGDPDALAEVSTLRDLYRATGTAQARAFRQRQDPLNGKDLFEATPEERLNSIVDEIYKKPKKQQDQRDKAVKNGDTKTVERIDKEWAKRLQRIEAFLAENGLNLDALPDVAKDPTATARAKSQINAADTRWDDKLYEYWQNIGLLSGPTTQIVNITGNVASGAWEFGINRPIEAMINSATGLDPSGALAGEIPYIWKGLRRGVSEGLRNALITWKTELPVTQQSKWDMPRVSIGGTKGRIIRAFGWRPLSTADEFFNSLFTNLQVGAEAYRQATIQGLEGEALADFIDSEVSQKDSLSWRFAKIHSAELTFQQENEGAIASTIGRLGRGIRGHRLGRWFVPFATFPVNSATVALRKAPITGDISMATKVYKNWRNGRRPTFGLSRDVAERVVAWGTLMAIASTLDDDEPWITGSETAPQGLPKNSIRIGDTWHEYGRVEPFATTLSLVVDGLMKFKTGSGDELATAPIELTASQISDKTFLRGISDAMTAFGFGGGQYANESATNRLASWSTRFGESFVPNFYRQTVEATRPAKIEYRTYGVTPKDKLKKIGERFAEGIEAPGSKPELKYDPWGRTIDKSHAPYWSAPLTDTAYRILSPTQNTPNQPTIGDQIIARYNNRNPETDYTLRPPSPYYTVDGERIAMTGEQYESFQKNAGQLADQLVQAWSAKEGKLVADGRVEPTKEHLDKLRSLISKARKQARDRLIAESQGPPKRKTGEPVKSFASRMKKYRAAMAN